MSHPSIGFARFIVVAFVVGTALLHAQSVTTGTPAGTDQAVVMDPFSVRSAGNEGYRALSSASGLGVTITVSS